MNGPSCGEASGGATEALAGSVGGVTDTGPMGARCADASCGAGGAGLVGTAREDVDMVLLLMMDVAVTSDVGKVLATDRFEVFGTDATVARGSNGVGGMGSGGKPPPDHNCLPRILSWHPGGATPRYHPPPRVWVRGSDVEGPRSWHH